MQPPGRNPWARLFGRFRRHRGDRPVAPDIYYLHIGKTAGTQISNVIGQINAAEGRPLIAKMKHHVHLRDIPAEARYFFSVRSPISRFRSGFYSRLREGKPRINVPWSACEKEAFQRFAHANDLAEALFEPGARGRAAAAAIKSIKHTAMNQTDWLCNFGFALKTRPPVWIVRQEHFEADLAVLLDRLGLRHEVTLTDDPILSHANDYRSVPPLSEKAEANLRRWYIQDFEFLALCEDWMNSETVGRGGASE